MESADLDDNNIIYPKSGNNIVDKISFTKHPASNIKRKGLGKVYINKTQYFDNVSEIAWNFYIGGYQPAQKWLKDRKGMALSYDDIRHYQKIIIALVKTHEIMDEIDKVAVV